MTAATIYNFQGFPMRVVTTGDGEPQWVATDIASILDYRDANAMTRGLREGELGREIVNTPGGDQEVLTINESGLYRIIARSHSPLAEGLRKWVASGVLQALQPTPQESFLTIAEAAEIAAVSEKTIRRLIAANKLEATRLTPRTIRIYRFSWDALLEKNRIKPDADLVEE